MKNLYGDVVEVVSRYVLLTKQENGRYQGQCPLCGKNSLLVDDGNEIFYCKNCGIGGNAPKFLALMEKINYQEACERLGIPVNVDNEVTPEECLEFIGLVARDSLPAETRLAMIQSLVGVCLLEKENINDDGKVTNSCSFAGEKNSRT